MARIILVRHGQTEWNRVERFRGRIDVPLNDTGLRQAAAAGKAIAAAHQVAAVYCSPLSRAVKTAEAIGRAVDRPAQSLEGLLDFCYGEWEGKTPQEVEAAYPEEFKIWVTRPQSMQFPGGDNVRKVRARLVSTAERIAAMHPEDIVVLVSHRMTCKLLILYLLGLPNSHLWRVDMDTAAISLFEKRRMGWLARCINDTCHLRE